jgi:putative spermidine/putrescine transport system permease protein
MMGLARWAGRLYATLMMIFLVSPLVMVIILSFNAGDYIAFPPDGFSLRWYSQIAGNSDLAGDFVLSVELAVAATVGAMAVGLPLSVGLVRHRMPGAGVVRMMALSPLVLPEVLLGLALLQFSAMRLHRNPGIWVLLVGHVILVLPFVVQLVSAALTGLNREKEDAAATLGASPARVFWHVVLPGLATGLGSAALLAFIFSFDNVAVSLFLSSPGRITLPVQLYEQATFSSDPSLAAMSTVLIVIGLATICLLGRLRGFDRVAAR